MSEPARARKRPVFVVIALGFATLFALGLAEIVLRLFVTGQPPLGSIGYAMADGTPIADFAEAAKKGHIVEVPGKIPTQKPRLRHMFAPGLSFFITYTDNDVLQRDWLDEQGRVINHMNSVGIRDREELVKPKPADQRRIVCLGDSFTFGWGIPVEQGWVRLLEEALRRNGDDVRTVNCGAAGTVCVDEYVAGLEHRFHRFDPDAVVLTLCLNDLIPSSGLNFTVPPTATRIRVLDLAIGALGPSPYELDPARDWVQELMDLPRDQCIEGGLCNNNKPYEAMWSQGVPQKSLRRAKAWCDERQIPFLVVIWPFLQGLGEGRHYPFQKLHDLVAADCQEAGIPLLDVLPQLATRQEEELWVTPADPHPNVLAQKLALPAIAEFVEAHTGW